MTHDDDRDGGGKRGEPRFTDRYDFSDLKEALPSAVAFEYLDNNWRLVPVDRRTGAMLVIEETDDSPIIPSWTENADIEIGIATGQRSGIVVLSCKGKLGQRTLRALLSGHEPLATLENIGRNTKYVLFKAPAEGLPSRTVAPGVDFLGEESFFVPSKSSWSSQCTELASLPDWLHSLVTGATVFGLTDMVVAGDLEALNSATPHEAALAYRALGWKLVKITNGEGDFPPPEKTWRPEKWSENPTMGLGIGTGIEGGVVGLYFVEQRHLVFLESVYGDLPLPRILGIGTVVCFRAPQESFPSRELYSGIEYISEDRAFLVPPSAVEGTNLRWQVEKEFSPGLPEIPPWLHDILSGKLDPVRRTQTPSQSTQQARQAGGAGQAQNFGDAAQRYAARGWPVFPLNTGGKTPRTKNGLHAATRDREKISKWWQKWRSANIGVQTGAESGLVVLDVDVKNGQPGLQSLAELERQHGRLETLRAHTPTDGLHLFFRAPAQVVQNRVGFLPGLDLRGQGGYIVVAPSRVGGQSYRWENFSAEIAEMPDWLLSLATARPQKGNGASPAQQENLTFAEAFAGVQEGSRNDTIFRLACKLRQESWEYDESLALVRTAAGNCQPPLPEEEALRCLDSAWRYNPPTALTDIGNAERFVARCGDSVRYVPEKERWLVWTDHCWKKNVRAVYRMAISTIQSLRDEAVAESDPDRKRLLFAHSRKSASAKGLERMFELVALELAVRAEDLDRSGLVAFTNGVFDPGTGALRPGRREDLLTKHAPIPYDPANPECLQWLERSESPPVRISATIETTERWRERLDNWLAERCEIGEGLTAKASELLEDFTAWTCEEVTVRRFGDLLVAKGFSRRKSSVIWYDGLRLLS
jgi:hypothetical protein